MRWKDYVMDGESTKPPDIDSDGALTDKQERFICEYMIDCNASRAATAAGYSAKTAGQIGHSLLKKVEIADEIARRQAQRAARCKVDADLVVAELAAVAFANPWDFLLVAEADDGGQVITVRSDAVAGGSARAVSSIRAGRGGVSLTMSSKVEALRVLAQHLGLLKPEVAVALRPFDPAELDRKFGAVMRAAAQRDVAARQAKRAAGLPVGLDDPVLVARAEGGAV